MPVFFSVEERDKKGKNMDEQKTIPRLLELRRIFKHSYAWSSHTLVCTDFH